MSDGKALVTRMFDELINKGIYDNVEEMVDEEFVDHGPAGAVKGRDTFVGLVKAWRAAVPDVHCEVFNLIAEGDLVAWVVRTTGTHTGDGLGFPATGKRIDTLSANVGRLRNGRALEHWSEQGMLAMLQQLGIIPEMAPPQPVG